MRASLLGFPSWVYKLLILLATMIWGFAFVVMKDAVDVLEPSYLIGVRFLATALLLIPFALGSLKQHHAWRDIKEGACMGGLFFFAFWLQTVGLVDTTPGKNAFLTGVYCVIVPFMVWGVMKNAPTKYNIIASLFCVVGIGFVSLEGDFTMRFGDLLSLLCAFAFAAHLIAVAKFSRDTNVMALLVYQFISCAICAFVCAVPFETAPKLSDFTLDFFIQMAYLVVFASCVALVIMNVAIAKVPPAQAALLLSLEAVFGVIFSVIFYGEAMTPKLLLGFTLIFIAIIISEAFPLRSGKEARAKVSENAACEQSLADCDRFVEDFNHGMCVSEIWDKE